MSNMTIPHIKQAFNRRFHPSHGPTGRPPPGPAQHDGAPRAKQGKGQSLALALVASFFLATGFYVENVEAAYIDSNGRIIEGFENQTFPDQPQSNFYVRTTDGTGLAQIDATTASEGTQSYKLDGTVAGANLYASFDLEGMNLCVDSQEIGGTRHIDFAVRNNEANGAWGVRLKNAGATDYAIMEGINSGANTGVWVAFNNNLGSTQSATAVFTNTVDTLWNNYSIRCGNTSVIFADQTGGTSTTLTLGTGTFFPTILEIYSAGVSAHSFTFGNNVPPAVNFDELVFGHPPLLGVKFCANPEDPPDFGFEYTTNWDFFEDFGFETNDGFLAETSTDAADTAFFGKGFDPGSTSFNTIVRIEAGNDADQSLFAIAYTTGSGGMPSGTTQGTGLEPEGLDGGNFDMSVQVIWRETLSNQWQIQMKENVGGTILNLGAAANHGDADSPATYQFTIDVETQLATVLDENGVLLIQRNINSAFLPGGIASQMKDVWFAASANLVLFNDALTVLDDPDQDEGLEGIAEDSTCIYDLAGTAVVGPGGSGIAPPSSIAPPVNGGDDGGGAGGELAFLDSPYFWVIVWIAIVEILLAALSWGSRAGFGGQVYLIAGMAVYIIGILLSIDNGEPISPWPIVAILVAIIGLAIWRR